MERRSIATVVCFVYAAFCVAILGHALVKGIMRPQHHVGPWLICAVLGLLCYGMATRRRWARALGLVVGIGGLLFWAMVSVWLYAFSGFSSRSGEQEISAWMVAALLPPFFFSIALLVLLVRPLPGEELGH
jgi:biotin transporter BioY